MEAIITLPAEVLAIAENVSVEKRSEVQTVLNQVFNGVSKMREQLDSVTVVDENDKVNMKLANTIRLGVRQVRLDAEKKVAAEIKAKQQAEVKAAKAPKKQKLNMWIDGMTISPPIGMNDDETAKEIIEKFIAFKKWAKTKIEQYD